MALDPLSATVSAKVMSHRRSGCPSCLQQPSRRRPRLAPGRRPAGPRPGRPRARRRLRPRPWLQKRQVETTPSDPTSMSSSSTPMQGSRHRAPLHGGRAQADLATKDLRVGASTSLNVPLLHSVSRGDVGRANKVAHRGARRPARPAPGRPRQFREEKQTWDSPCRIRPPRPTAGPVGGTDPLPAATGATLVTSGLWLQCRRLHR